jgi:thiamine pyrophosphokinase
MNFENFVLIFCNGELPSHTRIRDLLPHPKLIVCADGGANKALSIGYKPDLIVGDLDSLINTEPGLKETELIEIKSQDNTDFEKTLNVLLGRGFRDFLVVAFSGGRIDQTLANLQIAYEYFRLKPTAPSAKGGCQIILADNEYLIFPAIESFDLDVLEGADISIVPMEDGTKVSTSGLEYELHQASLRKGGHGISNRATRNKIAVTIHKGGVLVFVRDT